MNIGLSLSLEFDLDIGFSICICSGLKETSRDAKLPRDTFCLNSLAVTLTDISKEALKPSLVSERLWEAYQDIL